MRPGTMRVTVRGTRVKFRRGRPTTGDVMDPVAPTPAARDAETVARAARVRTADPAAAATGGVAAKGTTFSRVLEAATEGTAARGVARTTTAAETHATVAGHRYSRITAGLREGSYLNTSGNTRHGQAFSLVERGGRTFHVYGDGPDRRVVEIKPRAERPGPSAATPAPGVPAAATPAPAVTDPAQADPAPAQDTDAPDGTGGIAAPDDD